MSMTPDDSKTLAVVVQRLDDLRDDVRGLVDGVNAARAEAVSRSEWMLRNAHVDSRFEGHGREIGEIKRAMAAARAPWWSWLGPVVAVAALLWTTLGP